MTSEPFRSPAYRIIAVPFEKIIPNTYNPNSVAPPEMKLLYLSILEDGYTQPIVCYYSAKQDLYAIVKNPLADPYVLGVSSGASLGATLAILVGVGSFLGSGYVGLVAFAGAFLVSMGVIALANIGGRATSVKLILAGTALSAICAAVSNFFLYVINTSSGALEAVVRWTMGSLAAASWDTNLWMLAVAVLGALFFWTQYRTLNLMLLGDEAAVTLGTDLHRWRIVYLLAASLLVGFAVYTAGIIGFVGLVIPHVVRILFGTDCKRRLSDLSVCLYCRYSPQYRRIFCQMPPYFPYSWGHIPYLHGPLWSRGTT